MSGDGQPYLLVESDEEPWLAERGSSSVPGGRIRSLVVAYGGPDGPWVKLGLWGGGYSGREPDADERVARAKDDMVGRLVLAAAEGPEGAAFCDPEGVARRLADARASVGPWEPCRLLVDGVAHDGLTCGAGHHRIAFAMVAGRALFVQARDRPLPTEVVSWRSVPDGAAAPSDVVRDWR